MALGLMGILFMALGGLALVSVILLFLNNGKYADNNGLFIAIVVFSLVVAWLTFSSQPSNYIFQKIIAALWGIMALVSLALKHNMKDNTMIARVLLCISILGSIIQLFFG